MTYVQGFVLAVPAANEEAYRKHAEEVLPVFKELGATRVVECWGDDVPDGEVTDFKRAVQATDDEIVLMSWLEFPDKASSDAATARMMEDERAKDMGARMPFDGRRMIIGGFESIVEAGERSRMGYADGFLLAVPDENKDAYRTMAAEAAQVFRDHGASRVLEAWGVDVPVGKVTDYQSALQMKAGESAVYSWIEWPSKGARKVGMKGAMADARMKMDPASMPFDGQRMIFGGFIPILDA